MNDFKQDLMFANSIKANPWWKEAYFKYFTNALSISETVEDMQLQELGIDRVVHTEQGDRRLIDEKIRRRSYGDIALEWRHVYRDGETIKAGWMVKQLACHYIAYVIIPDNRLYMLDYAALRRTWLHYKDSWIYKAQRKEGGFTIARAPNQNYTTESICVPTKYLMDKLSLANVIVPTLKAEDYFKVDPK